jgi:hypothetical protein
LTDGELVSLTTSYLIKQLEVDPKQRSVGVLLTTLGVRLWQGGWVSMTTHMAVRSATMTTLLRYRGRRLGSEKSTISAVFFFFWFQREEEEESTV